MSKHSRFGCCLAAVLMVLVAGCRQEPVIPEQDYSDRGTVTPEIEYNNPESVDTENPADAGSMTCSTAAEEISEPADSGEKEVNMEEDKDGFCAVRITPDIFERIEGKSYPKDCPLPLDELRYLRVKHYDFEGKVCDGELIVNAAIADTVLDIFRELYAIEYPIEKLVLIDEYDADDERSMEDNNSSAFNYRYIAETTVLSNHALGYAIDINTLYNPYVYTRSDGTLFLQPVNSEEYVDRDKDNPYYIRHGDECYNIFVNHGFSWGGDWATKKDYQHFEFIR